MGVGGGGGGWLLPRTYINPQLKPVPHTLQRVLHVFSLQKHTPPTTSQGQALNFIEAWREMSKKCIIRFLGGDGGVSAKAPQTLLRKL